jgi:5-hydroxyisourate hydrolase
MVCDPPAARDPRPDKLDFLLVSAITTHVLDISNGLPAAGVRVTLESSTAGADWRVLGHGATDADGRLRTLMPEAGSAPPGIYRLRFETGAYFHALGTAAFHPHVTVTFEVADGEAHHHVPLLVSPFGYTTYRGS